MTRLRLDYADENDNYNYSNNNIPMQRHSNRNGNEKGGRLGIRKKLKKVSKELVCSNSNNNKNSIYNYSDNNIGIDSEVDLVSIDLRTPPTTPSPIQEDRNATSKSVAATTAAAQKKNAATAARTMSMMTPDMLETLGLTEVTMNNINTNTTDVRQYTRAYTAPPPRPTNTNTYSCNTQTKKSVRIDENRNTIQQSFAATPPQPIVEDQNCYSCGFGYNQNRIGNKHKHKRAHNLNQSCDTYDGDNENTRSILFSSSSSGSSSSNDSYEPIPRAPDDCDWTTEDMSADEYSDVNNTLLQYYKKAAGSDCDIASCLGMVFALPVACGLLCLDNLADTVFFGTSSQKKTKKTKSSSKSLPEVLAPRENAAEQSSSNSNSKNSNKTRTTSKTATATNSNNIDINTNNNDKKSQRKSSHRGRSKNDDDDAKSILDGSNCELFPSSIELPINKIIAPCW